MKKLLLFFLVACLLTGLFGPPAIAATTREEIDQAVDRIFAGAKTVGGSLIVLKDGQTVYERDYGFRNKSKKLEVDENTYFKMGCVTKMVASLAILQLVDEGKVELDQDISAYLGYEVKNPNFPKVPVTLRQLLSHTSTLSEQGGYSRLSNTLEKLLTTTSKRTLNYRKLEPGSSYQYSNFGSGVVGSVVEAVSGKSVNSFIQERLFGPLNMDAALSASLLSSPEDVASLYTNGKLYRPAGKYVSEVYEDFASPDTHYRTLVGGLFIRSRDLAKIAHILSTDGSFEGRQFLAPETILEMREQQHLLGKSVTGQSPYGLFLERNTRVLPGKVVFGHQGMTGASSNNVYFEPESGFVFVVTTNGCSQARDHGTIVLAQSLLRYTYPLFSGEEL